MDLNRNFPDLNTFMYYSGEISGPNHHIPLPDNWKSQVPVWGAVRALASSYSGPAPLQIYCSLACMLLVSFPVPPACRETV